jgi:hypothetical protein
MSNKEEDNLASSEQEVADEKARKRILIMIETLIERNFKLISYIKDKLYRGD